MLFSFAIICKILVFAYGETYMAMPGEFSSLVVIIAPDKNLSMGVLATEEVIITSCKLLYVDGLEKQLLSHTGYRLIGSNGDWQGDPLKQERESVFICVHPKCRITSSLTIFDVGAIVVRTPFRITRYIMPVYRRVQIKQLERRLYTKAKLSKIIERGAEGEDIFTIGGLACPNEICSKDSPVFRSFSKPLHLDECEKIINVPAEFAKKKISKYGLTCFRNFDEIGGQGCPIEFDMSIAAIGSSMKFYQDTHYLIATRFDICMQLVYDLYDVSACGLIFEYLSLVQVITLQVLLYIFTN